MTEGRCVGLETGRAEEMNAEGRQRTAVPLDF